MGTGMSIYWGTKKQKIPVNAREAKGYPPYLE